MPLLHFTRKKQTAALTAARKKPRETTEYSELKSAQQPKRLPVTGRVSAAPPLFGAARCDRIDRLGRPALSMQGPSATRPGVLHPRPEPDPHGAAADCPAKSAGHFTITIRFSRVLGRSQVTVALLQMPYQFLSRNVANASSILVRRRLTNCQMPTAMACALWIVYLCTVKKTTWRTALWPHRMCQEQRFPH